MNSNLTALVAREHTADLIRSAQREAMGRVSARRGPTGERDQSVSLRLAKAQDARALRALAELDDAPGLEGEVLLAVIDDQAVAALSLSDGRVVANPFVPTADTIALLRLRARHLAGRRPRRGRMWRLRPRFA